MEDLREGQLPGPAYGAVRIDLWPMMATIDTAMLIATTYRHLPQHTTIGLLKQDRQSIER
jgi:hypothetical protein